MNRMKPEKQYVDWAKGEMRLAVPSRLWRRYTGAARSVFYEMVCLHAGLRPESPDVQQAFKELSPIDYE